MYVVSVSGSGGGGQISAKLLIKYETIIDYSAIFRIIKKVIFAVIS